MNRLTTGLIVLTVVAGPPLLAFWWLLHHPLAWPSSQRLDAWRQQPPTAGTIVIGCLTVAAMAWLVLLYHLAHRAAPRWISRAGTFVIILVLVAGPPLTAVLWIYVDLQRMPTADDVSGWIEQPHAAVAALIGSIAVTGWLLLVLVIAHRVWRAVTGAVRRMRRAKLPSAAQVTAGSMAGVAALAMPNVVVDQPAGGTPTSVPAGTTLGGPQDAAAQAGIQLPGGGWVPYRTALAVTALGGAIWLHRRQHYQPGPSRFGQHDHDADLQPLPATADAIIAGVDDQPPLEATPGSPMPDIPAGLLSLHGPGAMDAARGLLITALLRTALADFAQTEVLVRAATFKALLGVSIPSDMPPGLRIGDTSASGVLGSAGGLHPEHPMLVIRQLTHASPGDLEPTEQSVDRLTAIVVGGDRHEGRRWHVGTDGRITNDRSGGHRRLCLLNASAATDLLRLVQQHAASTATAAQPTSTRQDSAPRRGQLRILGGCRLHVDGSPVHIRRSAGLQILAYLALHPTGATTTDLVRAIWPGLDPNTITKRLHTTLTDLRQQLQPTLDPIIRYDERYRLNHEMIDTDLDRLGRAITAAATAMNADQLHAAARAVVDAYHGELAAGFSWPWLQPARESLRRDVIDAYLRLAAAAAPAEALDLLRAAIAVDPHNEALRQQAQRLLTAVGDGDGAHALAPLPGQRPAAAATASPKGDTDRPARPRAEGR